MISVTVNGEKRQFDNNITVEDLLNALDIKRERLAVERNRAIVPRTRYMETVLEDGDSVEIVSLVGGG